MLSTVPAFFVSKKTYTSEKRRERVYRKNGENENGEKEFLLQMDDKQDIIST